MDRILVLGIGNTLLSDEGVGIHLLNRLRERRLARLYGVRWLDGGTLSFTLAPEIEDCDALLVLDAARLDAEPGTDWPTCCRLPACWGACLRGARCSAYSPRRSTGARP
jgi:Ni,Fe-hydrogenase maturation factor